ncbi:MAG TPA: efflux RND transporter periplasmic adaptor subunit [Candidatus Polarisedimenticolaceae bacterium]|nr:efflux RND transporter periplasmic adaptor subunit [Candidatus Polarisedimenticolaceae bacterium]
MVAGNPGPDLAALRIDEKARASSSGRRMVVPLAALAVLLVLTAAATFLVRRPVQVEVAVAHASGAPGAPSALLNASGYVTPRRRATVAAKVTGRVERIDADEGMTVTAGQVLAQLDDADARRRLAAVEAARAVAAASLKDLEVRLANAEREQVRALELERAGFGSAQAADAARTDVLSLKARLALAGDQVRAADADVAIARQDVDNTVVRAPFDGVIVSKDAQRGEMVSPVSAGGGFTRTGIATVVDMSSLEIEVDVNEAYIARVKPGQRVQATLDAYPDWPIPASVRTVIPSADRQKATVKVRISFDALDPKILPDMGVKVAFLGETPPAGAPARARVAVPTAAIREREGARHVFVVRDGRVERRAVTAAGTKGEETEIEAGLSEGETVVVRPPDGLKDGDRVRAGTGTN